MQPLVSVIIPVHNGEPFIAIALRSALAQAYVALEIIVVDDGSTDRTAEIVEAMAARDPRIRLYRQPKSGASSARNHAIKMSRGIYVAPLDADDIWHPQKVEKQVSFLERSPDKIGLVYCWTQRIDREGRILRRQTIKNSVKGSCFRAVVLTNPVGHASGALIRRDAIIAVGGYCETILGSNDGGCEDHKLYLQLAELYDFALIPEILVGYRRHDAGVSRNAARMLRAYDVLLDWVRQRHPELPQRLLRRSHTSLVFWLLTDTDDRQLVYTLWPVLKSALWADPLFMASRRFLGWFIQRSFCHLKRRFAHVDRATVPRSEAPLYMSSLYANRQQDDAMSIQAYGDR